MGPFSNSFLFLGLTLFTSLLGNAIAGEASSDANRLTYLDDPNPFYPGLRFPKLTTPQWIGESGVEAVVILAIDDMRQHEKYELMLRPILDRLKQIDGRAPVSIMGNGIDPAQPHLQQWLREGVSLEVHTLAHPCPFLAQSNFVAASDTYHHCVELLNRIAGNKPVAFRMPCCDSINSPSPRFYAEIFNRTNAAGQFLGIDSSVMNILTSDDPALPRALVLEEGGRERFRKYVPFPSFVTTIDNYPYPYVIGKLCWEFPAMAPSDWEAQHLHGTNNPATVADWKLALDATVLKQGTFSFIFHPHGWIRPDQMVEFIDYAVQRYGSKVKFLNFREAEERLTKNLLNGQPLRGTTGADNGVRLVDLNNDGYIDVVLGNSQARKTRLWMPRQNRWLDSEFPATLVSNNPGEPHGAAGVQFGVVEPDGFASMLVGGAITKGAWHFNGLRWVETQALLTGLEIDGHPVFTTERGLDRGVRLRDLDNDGRCEVIVGNERQNAVFAWSHEDESWNPLGFALPNGATIVDGEGADAGLRFVDVNEDGFDDVIFSGPKRYSLHLFVPKLYLGFQRGWSRDVLSGKRGEPGEIPAIVRSGPFPNNGAWFHSRHLWVQNEETSRLPEYVARRSYDELLGGLQPKPKSPEESLACMQVRPGFRIELAASEPLVQDPIAFEWGPDGKLWVVEMGDYPLGVDGHGKSGGIVRFLEDSNGDGHYDKSTVFLEGVNFPTGVMPWRKGVLVSAAPEIFYAEDRDGDGKADLRVPLYEGFREGNQQHRVNGFDYGLDNWIYGANGDSGGQVRSVGTVPGIAGRSSPPLSDRTFELRGHDFRFRPDQGLFETVAGQTQYGRHRDDWGHWFGNNNSTWLWHYLIPEQYLARNPNLPIKSVKRLLADYPEGTRVFAVSRSLQRFNDIGMLNHVTSANSATPYRDELFGPTFARSVFISEPVHNLVHCESLEPDGVSFQSHRPADEQDREFLASTDNWFRPTMLKTGPDGALYVADMYRLVLEHPEWIPADTQSRFDLRAGHELGRIYRVLPANTQLRPIPRLAGLAPASLVPYLASPNGWTRDTAQRLLVETGDTTVSPLITKLAREVLNPKGRLQALCTLDGMGCLTPALLASAMQDTEPSVREQAIRLSESLLSEGHESNSKKAPNSSPGDLAMLKDRLFAAAADPALPVRYQLAFTLGEIRDVRAGPALVRLAADAVGDAPIRTAVLSSAVPHLKSMLESIPREYQDSPPVQLYQELLSLAVTLKEDDALLGTLPSLSQLPNTGYRPWQFAALRGLLDGVERRNGSLLAFRNGSSGTLPAAIDRLDGLFDSARKIALDGRRPEVERVQAISLLGHGSKQPENDRALLGELLRPQVDPPLQKAALANLKGMSGPGIAALLLQGWRAYEPGIRNDVLNVLLSRAPWTEQLLQAVEEGAIVAGQISAVDQQKMLGHSQASIRSRAKKVFVVSSDRRQLLKDFGRALELSGNWDKGAAVFRQNCVLCHRFNEEGANVGPDLGALANKSAQTLLIAILDPNRAVESRYLNYTALTKSDRELSGIIVAETSGSVTLRSAGGAEETVLRSDLKQLASSGLSLMPEGFEKVLTAQDTADLIEFLRVRGSPRQ